MHVLSIEYTAVFDDYLQKVLKQIEKSKMNANEKLIRQCYFNSGVDFHSNKDPDVAKKAGINSFKSQSMQADVNEMNLDPEQIKQMKAKKEEMLKQRNAKVDDSKKDVDK